MPKLWKAGDAYIWNIGPCPHGHARDDRGTPVSHSREGPGLDVAGGRRALHAKRRFVYLGQLRARESAGDRDGAGGSGSRVKLKIGNRDLYGLDFKWIDEADIASRGYPRDAVILERHEWGNYHGYLKEIRRDGVVVPGGDPGAFSALLDLILGLKRDTREDTQDRKRRDRRHKPRDREAASQAPRPRDARRKAAPSGRPRPA